MRLRQATKDRALRETAGRRAPGRRYVLVNGVVESIEEEPQMSNEPTYSVVTLTPELASKWLESSVINRAISQANVLKYAEDIRRGNWKMNGSSFVFTRIGDMRDGHHRCHAVIIAGVAIRVLVVEGVDPAAVKTIDTGKSRTLQDVLRMAGIPNSGTAASALRWVYKYHSGKMSASTTSLALSTTMEEELLSADPRIVECSAWADSHSRAFTKLALGRSLGAALYHIFSELPGGEDDAVEFFDRLFSGASLDRGSPILCLRDWLSNNKSAQGYSKAAHAILAWNHYRDGNDELGRLLLRAKSPFPTAR